MGAVILEVILAIIGIAANTAISDEQMRKQENRSSRETYIRQLYQAVKNRFGISIDQLNQVAEQLGFKLNQITDATRGSARLSTAMRIYRDFIKQYPDTVKDINQKKNIIANEINNLEAKENATAAKIQKRETVKNQDVLNDISSSLTTVTNTLGGDSSYIDTTLKDAKERLDSYNDEERDHNDDYKEYKPYSEEEKSNMIENASHYGDGRRQPPKDPRVINTNLTTKGK